MDELNEAYLDRMLSKMEQSFDNLSEFDKIEYVKRIKSGLSKILDDSFYKMFKNGYREMGNNFIDRDTIREIASEYREVVEYIHDIKIETGEDRLKVVKDVEAKLKETSFYDVDVSHYDDQQVLDSGYVGITVNFQPLRGMGIFNVYLHFSVFDDEHVLNGLDNVNYAWDFKNKIVEHDTQTSTDEYTKDEEGDYVSVKTTDQTGWEQQTDLSI
jgi:hypothetical protein